MGPSRETIEGFGFVDPRNEAILADGVFDLLDAARVIEDVQGKVVGQQSQIIAIVEYIMLWLERCRAICEGVHAAEVPRLSSLLLIGPTASGKTYVLKTICETMGLPLTVVNAALLTGSGWRGASVENELFAIAKKQDADPDGIQVVLFDEFDKLRASVRTEADGFNAQPDLLKALDGGIYRGVADDSDRTPYELDVDRVLFLFAGAFTGLGKRFVAPRLRKQLYAVGNDPDEDLERIAYSEDENLLREQAGPEDLIHWGIIPEFTGRIGSIVSLPALTEDEMVAIVNSSPRSVQNRFARLMPEGIAFVIEDDAARLIAARALESGLGARCLESIVAPHAAAAARRCKADCSLTRASIIVGDDGSNIELSLG